MNEREIFGKTLWNAISNTFWFGLAAFVIVLTTKLWMPLAVALTVLYLIATAADVVWVLVTVIIPVLATIRSGREAMAKESWTFAVAAVRLLDVGAGILLGCYLYWRIFIV